MKIAAETGELFSRTYPTQICEHELLQALLHRGIFDALGQFGTAMPSADMRRAIQTRALRWIRSDKVHCCPVRGVSFAFVCEALNIDAVLVRNAVTTMLADRNAKGYRHRAPRRARRA